MRGKMRWLALLLALCSCVWTQAQAGNGFYGSALVEGVTSDRVHLRAEPSASSASLGLYYSGTQVECRSDPRGSWVYVTIGEQTGYMMARYLYGGYYTWTIQQDAPRAYAAYGTVVYQKPSAASQAIYSIQGAESVLVLGETWDHWCYVAVSPVYGSAVLGYLPSAWLSIGKADHSGGRMSYGLARIDGVTADRVHLRSEASAASASLGLFFTGTEVNCLSSLSDTWVLVEVGCMKGYIQGKYLRGQSGGSVTSRQPSAVVHSSSVNLRAAPGLQEKLLGTLARGESMTVLGETSDHWYFVRTQSDYGYVKADYVTLR